MNKITAFFTFLSFVVAACSPAIAPVISPVPSAAAKHLS
jgi:hypothetical protein